MKILRLKKRIDNGLSARSSFKNFIVIVVMLIMTTSSVMVEVIDGFRYILDPDTKTAILLSKTNGEISSDIVVPEKVKSNDGVVYVVTAFENCCFKDCRDLTSITIPSSVTSLGDECFKNCRSLTSITIPSSVTSLGNYCFDLCSGLTSITIPSSVTSLGEGCFKDCSGLTSITIPSSITSLGVYCFYGCI